VIEPGVDGGATVTLAPPESRPRRLAKVAAWLVGIVVVIAILQLLGVDVTGWPRPGPDQGHSRRVLIAAVIFQTGQTVLTGLSYYGILNAAYPGEVTIPPIVAAYAVGVAGNGFLPANIGTLVTLLMFVAIIPSATFGGSVAAYLVQKIFFTIAGTFSSTSTCSCSVPGTFDVSFGNIRAIPGSRS
jgi:hypothetical protein